MSLIALIGATLVVLIMNFALATIPFDVPTNVSILYFLVSLFVSVLVYDGLSE